jgi:hypothetical protein
MIEKLPYWVVQIAAVWFLYDKLKAWWKEMESRSRAKHEKRMEDPEYREEYRQKQRDWVHRAGIALKLSDPKKYWALDKEGKLDRYLWDQLPEHLSR